MGIPSYFKKVIDEFPTIIKTKSLINDEQIIFHNVFLDFNGCIHNCSNQLKSSDIIFSSNNEFEKALIENVLKYIDNIYDFIQPKELLYISIDGIPPRSKMVQQRNRRFLSSWKKNKLIESLEKSNVNSEIIDSIKNEWNSSAISPGTKFMNTLSSKIKNHFETSSKYKYIKTVISDSLEEGEGEFKIFKYLKSLKNNIHNKNNIIYGLDADLIMLSLLRNNNIYLLREPTYLKLEKNDPFLFISIEELKKNLILFYKHYFNNTDNLIEYYVFLCFLIGNDFIPHLSFLKFKKNGLEILLMYYKKVYNQINENILIINYTKNNINYLINYNFLSNLFQELSKIENEKMEECTNEFYNKRPFHKSFKDDEIIKKHDFTLELYPILNRIDDKIKAGIDNNWRQKYYYYQFNTINGNDIKDINHNFLESLEFTLDYYYHQKYHPTWYYRYTYSPTILDLSNYLQSLNINPDINSNLNIENEENNENNENKIKPFKIDINFNELYPNIKISIPLQLLMILPPSSIDLIENTEQKKLMTDINKGVLHYYPIDFGISTYLKNWLWLCQPKLPDIDINLLNSKLK